MKFIKAATLALMTAFAGATGAMAKPGGAPGDNTPIKPCSAGCTPDTPAAPPEKRENEVMCSVEIHTYSTGRTAGKRQAIATFFEHEIGKPNLITGDKFETQPFYLTEEGIRELARHNTFVRTTGDLTPLGSFDKDPGADTMTLNGKKISSANTTALIKGDTYVKGTYDQDLHRLVLNTTLQQQIPLKYEKCVGRDMKFLAPFVYQQKGDVTYDKPTQEIMRAMNGLGKGPSMIG